MASTNKTANLHLNQWAATDPVLREDFNADNAAIDAALDCIPSHKIRDVTISQNAMAVEVDLSDIDLDDYAELRLFFWLDTAGDGSLYNTTIRFNSSSTDADTALKILSNNAWNSDGFFSCVMPNSASYPSGLVSIRMHYTAAAANGNRLFAGTYRNICILDPEINTADPEYVLAEKPFFMLSNRLEKLVLQKVWVQYPACKPIKAGSRILICGVKK